MLSRAMPSRAKLARAPGIGAMRVRAGHAGFSLVELMVAMVLGLIVSAAVVALVVAHG